MGREVLTLYAFSSENWKRPESEVGDLMGLLRHFIQADLAEFEANNVRLRVIGNCRALEPSLVAMIENAIARTAHNSSTRSEEHTSELQSLMRISYAVFCLKKQNNINEDKHRYTTLHTSTNTY